ncbi:MAG: hypothetical protein AB1515_01140 [Nitrospirota bacterium]
MRAQRCGALFEQYRWVETFFSCLLIKRFLMMKNGHSFRGRSYAARSVSFLVASLQWPQSHWLKISLTEKVYPRP